MEKLMNAYKKLLRVAIVGAPNAGKSTLLNRLVSSEISCVSNKVHTTRQNVLGVRTEEDTQLEFYDSPGVVTRKHLLKHRLEHSLYSDPGIASQKCDLIAVVVDAANIREKRRLNKGVLQLLHEHSDKQSVLILNKVDLVKEKRQLLDVTTRLTQACIAGKCTIPKKELFRMSLDEVRNLNLVGNLNLQETAPDEVNIEDKYKHVIELDKDLERKRTISDDEERNKWKYYTGIPDAFENPDLIGYKHFSEVFSISASNDEGVDEVRDYMLDSAKPVPIWPHGGDYLTNQTTKDIALGIIRGKVMDFAKDASPYLIKYKFLDCQYDDLDSLHINLKVLCPQKYMVGHIIGENGVNIFRIINESRVLISKTLACDVKLNIVVEAQTSK